MKNRASAYAVVMTAVALAFLYFSLPEFISTVRANPSGIGIWFLLLVAAGILTNVAVKGGGGVTGTAVVAFAILVTFGGAAAAWLAAVATLILGRVLLRSTTVRSLADMSQTAVSLVLAGLVYRVTGGTRLALTDWSMKLSFAWVMPFVLSHLTCFFTTTCLESIRSSVEVRRSAFRTWRATYLWMLPQSFAVPVVGVSSSG
jgi:hypothetical protein